MTCRNRAQKMNVKALAAVSARHNDGLVDRVDDGVANRAPPLCRLETRVAADANPVSVRDVIIPSNHATRTKPRFADLPRFVSRDRAVLNFHRGPPPPHHDFRRVIRSKTSAPTVTRGLFWCWCGVPETSANRAAPSVVRFWQRRC